MELHHATHDVPSLKLHKNLHCLAQRRPLLRQTSQKNAGNWQLTGSLATTVFKHHSRIEIILQTDEGVDFHTWIFLVQPPLPWILFFLPIPSRLSLFRARAPNSLIAPKLTRRVTAMVALPVEGILPRHSTRNLQSNLALKGRKGSWDGIMLAWHGGESHPLPL